MDQEIQYSRDEIIKFAEKYIAFFEQEFGRTRESFYRFFDNDEFPRECRQLGFEMDCGQSFNEKYGAAWNNLQTLRENIHGINDISIIGNGLFSQWRFYNHWSSPLRAEGDAKDWFLTLFKRLKELCEHTFQYANK